MQGPWGRSQGQWTLRQETEYRGGDEIALGAAIAQATTLRRIHYITPEETVIGGR